MKAEKHTIKRILAAAMAAACIISGIQMPGTIARAETAASADGVTEEKLADDMQKYIDYQIDYRLQYYLSDDTNTSIPGTHYCSILTESSTDLNEAVKDNVPGEYYFPTESLWLHIGADGQRAMWASDGTNKYLLEGRYLIEEGSNGSDDKYIYYISDGITAKIVTHPDQEVEYASTDLFAGDEEIVIPDPPKATKIEMSQDYGSFQFVSGSDDGYATGKDTTYITSKAFDGAGRVAKLVIRSTKITSISKNALCEDNNYKLDIKKGIKIYLPKSKFNKYKSMLLKCYGVKQAKPKFYTLDKWDGKLGKWLGKKYLLWLEGDGWRDVMKADRIEALKGTDLEGSKSVLDR